MSHFGVRIKNDWSAEVDNFYVIDLVIWNKEKILWFEISVDYVTLVAIYHTR